MEYTVLKILNIQTRKTEIKHIKVNKGSEFLVKELFV